MSRVSNGQMDVGGGCGARGRGGGSSPGGGGGIPYPSWSGSISGSSRFILHLTCTAGQNCPPVKITTMAFSWAKLGEIIISSTVIFY